MRLQPASLGCRHGFATERVFTREPRPLQLLFDGRQWLECGLELRPSGGEALSKGDEESQAILDVLEFGLADQPGPNQVRVCEQYPWQCLR